MNKIIRWGIIGCGDVTEAKSGPGFQKADGTALVAVMRRDADRAKDYASRHNVPRWYADADALIADREMEASGDRRLPCRARLVATKGSGQVQS